VVRGFGGSLLLAIALAGCGETASSLVSPSLAPAVSPSAAPSQTARPTLQPTDPATVVPSETARPEPTVGTTRAPTALHALGFARIVIPELNFRIRPSTSEAVIEEYLPDGSTALLRRGTRSRLDEVYILDGPVEADGYRWWRVHQTEELEPDTGAVIAESFFWGWTGWVADGDDEDAWLVPASPCPASPVTTADVTLAVASWAIRYGCFRGQSLTFRGWYAGDPVNVAVPANTYSIFPGERPWYYEAWRDRLDFKVVSGGPPLPEPGQWIDIVGQFDDPELHTCFVRDDCSVVFLVSEIIARGP
jgi:hypothetical protein